MKSPFNDLRLYSLSEVSGKMGLDHLRDVKPSQIKKLANGNEIRIYQTSPDEKDKACKSYVEVDLKTGKIVDSSFSGSQCLRTI